MMENMSAAQLTTRRLAFRPRPALGGIVNPRGSWLPFILFCQLSVLTRSIARELYNSMTSWSEAQPRW